ncbi:leucine-rich repeat domain-containing protein [Clostridium felsineum]|uniref:leucine-rich repeat domain-containing protein n=1 Tax=Clostridium felsineum TaxID=36839 RepID=UPI00214D68B5|nr:leucine-rich repeat domain-containing protein [Clostridium felsineum]MCR3761867.1 leucine-rich repeat domain-containing protein [Clostridium felsineum]
MNQSKIKLVCISIVILLIIITGVYAYKYNQYKIGFNKAMSQLENEKYDDSINLLGDIINTYFGKSNSHEIKKEIEKAKKFKANKKVYDEALKLFNNKKYLEAIDSFKKIPKYDKKRYGLAQKKINKCKSSYVSLNIENAKYEAKCYDYDSALNSIALVLTLDAANRDASILKDEYIKKKKLGFDYVIKDDSIKIIKCLNYGTDITIPEEIDGKSVNNIGEESFFQHKDMISVTVPQSITSIEGSAFYRCYALEKITIPKNVKQMGNNPFFRCSSLTHISVALDNKNFSELDGVLYNNDKSVLLAYPEGKTNESFTVPSSVIKIDGSAFGYNCEKLKTIIIPSNVIDFPDYNMFVYPDQITLKVKSGSAAEQYAKTNNLKFENY